ncbi:Kinesin-like protein KIN-7D, mitochondrial [Ancistrocladus abbreviatus]
MSKLLVPWDRPSHMANLHYQVSCHLSLCIRQFWFVGDLKIELQASKQREAALEAALAKKEFAEEECRKKVDEAKKREAYLENDLANMLVLVAKLKKEGGSYS